MLRVFLSLYNESANVRESPIQVLETRSSSFAEPLIYECMKGCDHGYE